MDIEAKIKVSHQANINLPSIGEFIKFIQSKLTKLNFNQKRLAFEMLGITVWLDGDTIELKGTIDDTIVKIQSIL
jgi:hypothetical protein